MGRLVIAAVVGVSLSGFGLRSWVSRHEPQAVSDAALAPLAETSGEIDRVERGEGWVRVKTHSRELTLHLDESTSLFLLGRMGALDELHEGQEVRAVFEDSRGHKLAQWIEVTSAQASPVRHAEHH